MDGRELKELVLMSCSTRDEFRGVFAIDTFNSLLRSGNDVTGAFFINQSPRGEAGSHWASMHVTRDVEGFKRTRSFVFFDSLGQGTPLEFGIVIPAQEDAGKKSHGGPPAPPPPPPSSQRVLYNTVKIQPSDSKNCGLYSMYVLHWLTSGVDLREIMETFSTTELDSNERKVIDFSTNLKKGLFKC